jgi:hypothetical protein
MSVHQESTSSSNPIQYEYRIIPFIGKLKSGVFSIENANAVTAQLQAVIDQNTTQGWEFHSMEKVDVEITPGCLAGLLGSRVTFVTFDQIVFRRPR